MRSSSDPLSLQHPLSSPHSRLSSIISPTKRSQAISEAQPLLTAHLKCKDLWTALQMADYKKEGILNDAAVTVMFEKEKEKFKELLRVNNSDELQVLLDENEDGFLNEDEQVLLFSLIKERMQSSADALCSVHEYSLYKDMMKSIRTLESDIVTYQEVLRKRTHEKELTAYRELGEEKVHNFRDDWKRRFEAFREESRLRAEETKAKHKNELKELDRIMKKEKEGVKVKPRARLRNLLVEERLIAINERYNEAQKIRTELKALEQVEQYHFESKLLSDHSKRRSQLLSEQSKELRQVYLKAQTAYNTLTIRMKQQYSRLQKEIKLYFNDITKNQNLAMRLARKLGETRDELRRTKRKAREMMELMSEAKVAPRLSRMTSRHTESLGSLPSSIVSSGSLPQLPSIRTSLGPSGFLSLRTSPSSILSTASPLRQSIKSITKFSISPEIPSSERPINTGTALIRPTVKSKLTADLIGKHTSKSQLKSLGKLYSDTLTPLETMSEEETA